MNIQIEQMREQSLGDVLSEIWRGKVFVIVGAVVALIAAAGFMAVAVPHYKAQMVIAPASPMQAMQGNRSAGHNSAVNQSSGDMNFTRFESVFQGASTAKIMLRDDTIRSGLENDKMFRFQNDDRQWSAAKLSEYIANRVHVDPVGESAMRVLSYQHENPAFAAVFLRTLHETADGLIRHSMRKDVNERINYLQGALATTLNPDHRRALTALLMEQERLKMLVSIEQPYAAAIVEPAYPLPKASWPDGALVLIGFGLAGAFLGYIVFSMREAVRAQAKTPEVFTHGIRDEDQFDLDFDKPLTARQREIQEWIRKDSENNNEKPLTGRKQGRRASDKGPFSSSDAAE